MSLILVMYITGIVLMYRTNSSKSEGTAEVVTA
jgi:hypothetical protein